MERDDFKSRGKSLEASDRSSFDSGFSSSLGVQKCQFMMIMEIITLEDTVCGVYRILILKL